MERSTATRAPSSAPGHRASRVSLDCKIVREVFNQCKKILKRLHRDKLLARLRISFSGAAKCHVDLPHDLDDLDARRTLERGCPLLRPLRVLDENRVDWDSLLDQAEHPGCCPALVHGEHGHDG